MPGGAPCGGRGPGALSACVALLIACAAPAPSAAVAATDASAAAVVDAIRGRGTSTVSARFCDDDTVLDARQQDRTLRFASIVRDTLQASGAEVALIARSGMDLSRFAIRFSHAGIAIAGDDPLRWSVRQLYYACDERRPRLYDQGVAGFLMNADAPRVVHVSLVLLPRARADTLAAAARDRDRALALLAARYSAIAFPFSDRYQNCNQWVLELMALAWGDVAPADGVRAHVQAWLAQAGYRPSTIEIGSHLVKFLATFMPLLPLDDHPEDERYGLQVRTVLPESIEAFARHLAPQAERIELCHDGERVVVRRGWSPIADGCRPEPGDQVRRLDG